MNSQTLIFKKSSQTRWCRIGEFWNKKSSAPKSAKSKAVLCAGLLTPHPHDRRSPPPCCSTVAARRSAIRKRSIKRHAAWLEVDLLHELARFPRTLLAIHADV